MRNFGRHCRRVFCVCSKFATWRGIWFAKLHWNVNKTREPHDEIMFYVFLYSTLYNMSTSKMGSWSHFIKIFDIYIYIYISSNKLPSMCSKIFSPLTYLQSFLLRSRSFYNKYKIVTCIFFLVNRYRKNEQHTVIAVLSFDDSQKCTAYTIYHIWCKIYCLYGYQSFHYWGLQPTSCILMS